MSLILLQKIKQDLANLLFPENCTFCGLGNSVCCDKCKEKFQTHINYKYNIYSVFDYRNYFVKELIHRLKYKHQKSVAEIFAKDMSDFILDKFNSKKNKIILIPIPLSQKDRRMYNHVKILSEKISDNLNINSKNISCKVLDILEKNNKIKQAHTKSRSERLTNLENKIVINFGKLNEYEFEDYFIVIIDDVFTTGSTILEAEKVLEKNNIKVNLKLCIAH